MVISKSAGLRISEQVFKGIKKAVSEIESENELYIDTFNNCRETGYCFKLYNYKNSKQLIFWVYEHRSSDDIVLRDTMDSSWNEINNTYNNESVVYKIRFYKANEVKELIKDVIRMIEIFDGGELDD